MLPASIEASWRNATGDESYDDDGVPFFVLAGLMGSERQGRRLPSHAGQSLPKTFQAPSVPGTFQGLFPGGSSPLMGASKGPSIPSGRLTAARPGSAPPQQPNFALGLSIGGIARPSSAAVPMSSKKAPPPPPPPPPQQQQQQHDAPPSPAPASARRRGGRATSPPLQTLDRVLEKELTYGRIGFPSGHYRAPSNRMPATFTTSLLRDRGKSRLNEVAMLPSTMRKWEEGIHRRLAARSPPRSASSSSGSRLARPSSAGGAPPPPPLASEPADDAATASSPQLAAPPPAAAATVAPGELPTTWPTEMSPYEMRKFFRSTQRYFLAVDKKAFSVGPKEALTNM